MDREQKFREAQAQAQAAVDAALGQMTEAEAMEADADATAMLEFLGEEDVTDITTRVIISLIAGGNPALIIAGAICAGALRYETLVLAGKVRSVSKPEDLNA